MTARLTTIAAALALAALIVTVGGLLFPGPLSLLLGSWVGLLCFGGALVTFALAIWRSEKDRADGSDGA